MSDLSGLRWLAREVLPETAAQSARRAGARASALASVDGRSRVRSDERGGGASGNLAV